MKTFTLVGLSSALLLSTTPLGAQIEDGGQTARQLQEQLQKLQRQFEEQQRLQQQQIEALKKQIDGLQQAATPPAHTPAAGPGPASTGREVVTKSWSPSNPIRIGSGGSYADIGLIGTFAVGGSTARDIEGGTQLGGHDPNQRGFTVQGVELNLVGNVDPFFRANANINFQIDSAGETLIELEEAYMDSLSLPGNLQLRGGQFMTDFGRLNPTHPHSWSFVDQPLVNGRFLGGDGLRNPGARISWLLPTPFYSELFLSVQDSHGETAASFRNDHESAPYLGRLHTVNRVSSFGDMLWVPRYAMSFDLTDNQTLVLGASAAFGSNGSGQDTRTQIYGFDTFWKWKSSHHHAGFPFVTWQTEGMLRKYSAGAFDWDLNTDAILDPGEQDADANGIPDLLPRERLTDYGLYSQLGYGFRQGWVAGLRGEYVSRSRQAVYETLYGDDPDRTMRWRVSPNLTWYPSEFSKIRLQYNHDWRQFIGNDHSIWLQFEFLLGAHAAHKF